MPEWLRVLKQREYATQAGPAPKKVLVLVSGAGQPRDIKANPHDLFTLPFTLTLTLTLTLPLTPNPSPGPNPNPNPSSNP